MTRQPTSASQTIETIDKKRLLANKGKLISRLMVTNQAIMVLSRARINKPTRTDRETTLETSKEAITSRGKESTTSRVKTSKAIEMPRAIARSKAIARMVIVQTTTARMTIARMERTMETHATTHSARTVPRMYVQEAMVVAEA